MPAKRLERTRKSEETAEALVLGMGMEEGVALKWSRETAGAMGRPAVGPLSRVMRDSPRWQVRWAAAKALGSIADPSSAVALAVLKAGRKTPPRKRLAKARS
jgi:hypothetical protein